jgi:uncharacterized protein YegP (UPF0339 family)
MRFQIYKGKDKRWYWRAIAGNGRIVADGSQGYVTKYVCRNQLRDFAKRTASAVRLHVPIEVTQ